MNRSNIFVAWRILRMEYMNEDIFMVISREMWWIFSWWFHKGVFKPQLCWILRSSMISPGTEQGGKALDRFRDGENEGIFSQKWMRTGGKPPIFSETSTVWSTNVAMEITELLEHHRSKWAIVHGSVSLLARLAKIVSNGGWFMAVFLPSHEILGPISPWWYVWYGAEPSPRLVVLPVGGFRKNWATPSHHPF